MLSVIQNTKDLKEFINDVDSIDSILPELVDQQIIISEDMARLVSDLSTMPELLVC